MGTVRGKSLSVAMLAALAACSSALAAEPIPSNIIFGRRTPGVQTQVEDPNLTVGHFAGGSSSSAGSGTGDGSAGASSGGHTRGPFGLPPNQALRPGHSVFSPNGRYKLTYQNNGDLVLINVSHPNDPLWHSGTQGQPGQVTMQLDGELVIFDAENKKVWGSKTSGNPGAQLSLRDDGNLVIYSRDTKVLWETDTAQHGGSSGGSGGSGGSSGSHGSSGAGGGGGHVCGSSSNAENIKNFIRQIRDANPGMINDCKGQPVANNFLIKTINELRKYDKRWGYFYKPDGRIPRDIIA
ncbi:MAG TPA: hypothetical protein VM598_09215, partial [Bdellovibrionota bacterium]|nr:hypothetical protein [Bdellovibrionota bacterium]